MESPTTNPEGRPTKYSTSYNKIAKQMCLLGATDAELAEAFGVAESTVNLWKITHPRFKKALQSGKIEADAKVAESLFKSATGYEYEEVTFEKTGEEDAVRATSTGELVKGDTFKKRVVKKHQPGNGRDALVWLKNRRKKDWRDKQEIESTNHNISTVYDWSEHAEEDNPTISETEGSSENSSE